MQQSHDCIQYFNMCAILYLPEKRLVELLGQVKLTHKTVYQPQVDILQPYVTI